MRKFIGIALAAVVVSLIAAQFGATEARAEITQGRVDCIPYDPATLRLTDEGAAGWLLERADGARFRQFDNRADAEAGLAVAKAHSSLCYIGRANKRQNRHDYVMEFWR